MKIILFRNWQKKSIKNIIVMVSVIAVVAGIWIAISSLKPPDRDQMEDYFQRDKADFAAVTKYFTQFDYLYINITESGLKKGVMFTGAKTRDKEIEEETVIKTMNCLVRKRGYRVIGRNDNTIFFRKWDFFEKERGIAFSINGEDPPQIEFLVKLEALSEQGWFYYEADYEEFRNR